MPVNEVPQSSPTRNSRENPNAVNSSRAGLALPGVADATLTNVDLDLLNNNFLYINNPGGWTIDEIRLGSTFAAVTPTAIPVPSSSMLIAGGLAAFVLCAGAVNARCSSRRE